MNLHPEFRTKDAHDNGFFNSKCFVPESLYSIIDMESSNDVQNAIMN